MLGHGSQERSFGSTYYKVTVAWFYPKFKNSRGDVLGIKFLNTPGDTVI
jgi:hypothetical protein